MVREIVLEADGLRVVDHLVGDGCIESAFVFARDVPEADGQIDEVAYAPNLACTATPVGSYANPPIPTRFILRIPATKRAVIQYG